MMMEGRRLEFEVDTGACKSVMSVSRYRENLDVPLKQVEYKLNVVSGQSYW